MNAATRLPFKTHIDGVDIANTFTGLIGSIQATRAQMVKAFGRPKVSASPDASHEWWIRFEDGVTVTVYDYRRCAAMVGDDVPVAWSVGGAKAIHLSRVHMAFRQQHNLRAFTPLPTR